MTEGSAPVVDDVIATTADGVDLRVTLTWTICSPVILDAGGKLFLGPLSVAAGVYRLTLVGGIGSVRPKIYIGQTASLRKRLTVNCRTPSSGQGTSLRINGLLIQHLAIGGTITLALATDVSFWVAGQQIELDLESPAGSKAAERNSCSATT
jgi:hypothetical protein